MRLSVIILTKNEERDIKECLESVKWAEEIIVVDTFSSDRTVEIAKDYTDNIFIKEWEGYARERNFAIEKASGDWILWIDADERVTPGLEKEIKEILHKKEDRYSGYLIARRLYFLGHHLRFGGHYPDYQLKLFRKGKGFFEDRRVHEKPIIEGRIGILKNDILHYSYRSLDEYFERFNRYTTLEAEEMMSRGRDAKLWNLFFNPFFKFFFKYFIRLGFLDGLYGFIYITLTSFAVFTKYFKLLELKKIRYEKDQI